MRLGIAGAARPCSARGALWWLSAIAFLAVAMAQPKWGRIGSPRPPGHDAILVMDVSRSMGTEDAVPNRLVVAVEAAEGLVNALGWSQDDRAAVVGFAGRGLLLCPLTENLGHVIDTLRRLKPGAVRPGGTDLGTGLDAALEAIGPDEHAQGQSIVVFSDGEDLADDRWRSRLDRLREQNIVVHAVSIGDADHGHPVPSGAGDKPLVYRGEPVISKRNDTPLEALAHETGGAMIRLGLTSGDLGKLYRTRIEPAERRRAQIPRISELAEGFPVLLALALTCLIAGCWPPGRGWSWRGAWLWPGTWPWRRSAKSVGHVSLMIALVGPVTGSGQPPGQWREFRAMFTLQIPPASGHAERSKSAAELVALGRTAYEAGKLDESLTHFESAARLAPKEAVPPYDAAAVLFRLGRYDEALQRYREARQLADSSLKTKIDYTLGNTSLALGDIPGAIHSYDECIASTARGAELDSVRHDAAINRDFANRQAQSPSIPQGQGSDDPTASHKSDRRNAPDRRDGGETPGEGDEPETGPPTNGAGGEEDSDKAVGRDRPPRSRRRFGGAGGGRTTPPNSSGESPEDRLNAALESVRAAQSRRLPDEPPPASATADRRDW